MQRRCRFDEKLLYDIYNNLIGTSLNGTPQQWTVWDGKNPYLQFDSSGQLTQRYITDPKTLDHFFAQVGANGDVEWLLTDKQGSVRAIMDDSGTMLDQFTYDAYGNILSQTDASKASVYLFQGGYYDSTLGLYRFGERWYDTHNGRWLSEDPLGLLPDSDPYRFVGNSPTNFTDPSGELIFGIIVVGAIAGFVLFGPGGGEVQAPTWPDEVVHIPWQDRIGDDMVAGLPGAVVGAGAGIFAEGCVFLRELLSDAFSTAFRPVL